MKRKFNLILCGIILFGLTACTNKEEILKEYELEDENLGVIVVTDDKNVNETTQISVKENQNDYSNIMNNINKYTTYDISLNNNSETVNIKNKTKVYLKVPKGYDTEKLIVYYVLDNEIKETFNVKVVEKNKDSYAMFETNHFSIYVLAELKEKNISKPNETITEKNEEDSETNEETNNSSKENKETNDKKETNGNSNTNSNNVSSEKKEDNTSSAETTVNLVGNWKCADAETYYTFNRDWTGILYINHTDETVKYPFVWGFQDNNLSIRYEDSGMGSTSEKIKVYSENKIDIQPSKKLIYNRYYGEMPNNKLVQKNLKFKVEYINMPSGLEFVYVMQKEAEWYVRTTDESLLNKTYTVTYDLANCTVDSCSVMPKFNTPKEIVFSSSVVEYQIKLRKKRYYGHLSCNVDYTNFDSTKYNIDLQGKVFGIDVYSENQSDFDNSKCQATVDMSKCNQVGECTVEAKYSITSGNAKINNPNLQDYFTVILNEK